MMGGELLGPVMDRSETMGGAWILVQNNGSSQPQVRNNGSYVQGEILDLYM
jgi:hypothetical protein